MNSFGESVHETITQITILNRKRKTGSKKKNKKKEIRLFRTKT